jgi:hypothetical protein
VAVWQAIAWVQRHGATNNSSDKNVFFMRFFVKQIATRKKGRAEHFVLSVVNGSCGVKQVTGKV